MSARLRPELEPLPGRIMRLPVHRGYPVPWFVEWVKDDLSQPIGTGTPEFRVMSTERLVIAHKERRCWICSERLGAFVTFTIGPMCAINRVSSEPPSHRECSEWAARNCPFLARPHMVRREGAMPTIIKQPAGIAVMRNPGVALCWTTRRYKLIRPPGGGVMFRIGNPIDVSWWAEGRAATRAEVQESIDTGLPQLQEMAQLDGPAGVHALEGEIAAALELLPA